MDMYNSKKKHTSTLNTTISPARMGSLLIYKNSMSPCKKIVKVKLVSQMRKMKTHLGIKIVAKNHSVRTTIQDPIKYLGTIRAAEEEKRRRREEWAWAINSAITLTLEKPGSMLPVRTTTTGDSQPVTHITAVHNTSAIAMVEPGSTQQIVL